MKVEFESAILSTIAPDQELKTTLRSQDQVKPKSTIGWFVQSRDINSASVRYRCFHFARVLEPRFESLYFTSSTELQEALPRLDAIIIVKRLDRILEIAGTAKLFDVPVFLDLCDDLIAPDYAKNELGMNLMYLRGAAGILAGVTVPSAVMGSRVEGYARDNGFGDLPVHVIPDIAETWETYRATFKAVAGSEPTVAPAPVDERGPRPKRIVWFGNYGASHSNFGIFSLKPYLKPLRAVHQDIPLELVVISNSEPVYRALVHDCGFPTRYVPWSASAVYSELAAADAALLTSGDDDFCSIKSSNRVLQALAMGVPVIAPRTASLSEFEDAVFSGHGETSLRLCLGPGRERAVGPRLEAAQVVLERYGPERLGRIWEGILNRAIEKGRDRAAERGSGKLLFVFEAGDRAQKAKRLLSAAKKIPTLDYDILVSTELLDSDPGFYPVLARAGTIPRFFSGGLKARRNLLAGHGALVVERPAASTGRLLSGYAEQLGIPVITSDDAVSSGLDRFANDGRRSGPLESNIHAGPFPERLNADGTVDWAFIVHENARGWILDAICREIGSRQPDSWQVFYHPQPSLDAKNYFFSHYLLFESYLEREPELLANSNVFVWYTHPREEDPVSVSKRLLAFDHVTKVIFACGSNRQIWLERGLPEAKTAVVLGAADPAMFRFHERGKGVVGLSSSFYERKNPDCLLEIIKLLPHRDFVLVGRKWEQYALFEEMKALPNFTYKSPPYREYPGVYSTFDVFLSMSNLEGGPIPLVEAMMSNAVPVASRTGFAPDLIRHGRNGFIFDLDAPPQTIADLIGKAFELTSNVRETVEAYDWDNFSASIVKLAE
jgi:glycosyltransferase involved in cell wall biosynthesis